MTRYADLPPADRAAVDRALADRGPATVPRSAPAARSLTTRARGRRRTGYVCSRCGHREKAYAAAERHADTHGAARIDAELEAGA